MLTNRESYLRSPQQRQQSFEAYLSWLQELEAKAAGGVGVYSKQYRDDSMDCYTRSSRFCSGAGGVLSVCFASIEVQEWTRGAGYLSELLEYLEANVEQLQATHFYFENVLNWRLAKWLLRRGFQHVTAAGREVPCFFRAIDRSSFVSKNNPRNP